MFEHNQVVVIVDKDNSPIALGHVSRVTSSYVVVNDTHFSSKTGKALSKQPDNYSRTYTYPDYPKGVKTAKFSDISGRIEAFDMSLLQDVAKEKQKFTVDLTEGLTVSQILADLKTDFYNEHIPDDAIVDEINGDEWFLSYTRKETIKEYDFRMFRQPIIEAAKKQSRKKDLEEQLAIAERKKKAIEDEISSL